MTLVLVDQMVSSGSIGTTTPVFMPLVSSVNAEGWSAEWATGTPPTFAPDVTPQTVPVSRAGFDATGAITNYSVSRTITRRKRQLYPNQAQDTPTTVAFSDYLYSTDVINGAINNSTEISPKPIAEWVMPSRLLVGNSVRWEMIAFHRDARQGRQVVCVRVRGNDGTTQTPWQTVISTALSTLIEDVQPIEVFSGDLDVSALATGLFWLEAEVNPWIGAAASVLKSEDQSDPREFSRRYFTKNVALAAAYPVAYVSSTGNDTTGVSSTNAVTAAASPCFTVGGALIKAKTAFTNLDGLIVYIVDTVGWGTGLNGAVFQPQVSAAVTITRAPGTARSAAILQQSATISPRLGLSNSTTSTLASGLTEAAIILKDITIQRTAGQISNGSAQPLYVQKWNVAWDNGSVAGTWIAGTGATSLYGVVYTNLGTLLGYGSTTPLRLMRGVTATMGTSGCEEWVKIGCKLTNWVSGTFRDATKGVIWYNNVFPSPANTGSPISVLATNAGDTITGVVVVQNLIEITTASNVVAIRLSGDGANGSIVHGIVQHNTVTGYGLTGRQNFLYDESQTPSLTNRRYHRLMRDSGNVYVQLNTKGGPFLGTNGNGTAQPSEAPNRTGEEAYAHGVGCHGNFSMFSTASPAFEAQIYPGIGSIIGQSATVRNDPLFLNYQGTNGSGGTATAGSGNGSYPLQPSSPARGIVASPVTSFALDGSARGTGVQAAGAYA